MLRVAIIDDEVLARQGMRELLSAHPEVLIVGEAQDRASTVELLEREKPDAVFLDIQMPGGDGFEILRDLPSPPKVIFVTAHSKHAVRAFEVQAVDYLLKPVRPERLAEALVRLRTACGGAAEIRSTYSKTDRICLRTPERTVIAPVLSICVLEADGDFTRVFVADSPAVMICQPLTSFEDSLPTPPFLRIDRSLMVNIERIARIDRKSRDEATLILRGVNAPFPLGRTAQLRLRKHII